MIVILCCIIGNAVDTTQDACQGDSGGPLVGHFNDQIKPLELFPDELEDVVDIDIKDVLPNQKPKEELSQLEDETDINKIYEEDQSDSDNIDPNDMRLEDFVKLDLSGIKTKLGNLNDKSKDEIRETDGELNRKYHEVSDEKEIEREKMEEETIVDLINSLKRKLTTIRTNKDAAQVNENQLRMISPEREVENIDGRVEGSRKKRTVSSFKSRRFPMLETSKPSGRLIWLNTDPNLKPVKGSKMIEKRSLTGRDIKGSATLSTSNTNPLVTMARDEPITVTQHNVKSKTIKEDVVDKILSRANTLHEKKKILVVLDEIAKEYQNNSPNLKKQRSQKSLTFLNPIEKLHRSKDESREYRSVVDGKNLMSSLEERGNDHQKHIFRTFNYHQPAEGEILSHQTQKEKNYRVTSSKMKRFLDRIQQKLDIEQEAKFRASRQNVFGTAEKMNSNILNINNRIAEGKQSDDKLDDREKSKKVSPQRQNSKHLKLKRKEKSASTQTNSDGKNRDKAKNLGRFLWSIPNNDTKVAVQSMINAGIQASILSALEHFKELQQQHKYLQHHKVSFTFNLLLYWRLFSYIEIDIEVIVGVVSIIENWHRCIKNTKSFLRCIH